MYKVVRVRIPETNTLCPLKHASFDGFTDTAAYEKWRESICPFLSKTSTHLSIQSFKHSSICQSFHPASQPSICQVRFYVPQDDSAKLGSNFNIKYYFYHARFSLEERHAEIFTRVSFKFSTKLVTLPRHSTKNHSHFSVFLISVITAPSTK